MSTRKGRDAEEKASCYLRRRGYTVLDRNARAGRGELDIVVRKTDVLAFVEVKRRLNREDGLLAVHRDKQERLRSAATAWLARHPGLAQLQCRFDLIILIPGKWFSRIEHLRDVFR